MFSTYLFDLDGTISDSFLGVSRGMEYALETLGFPEPPQKTLLECMGPPLFDLFTKNLGLPTEQAQKAVALYREYYRKKGIFEQTLMAGAMDTVRELKSRGRTVCLATCKLQENSEIILKNAGIDGYFDVIVGSSLDGKISLKAQVISLVLEKTGKSPSECLMIGDRNYDVLGAHECGVKCAGVLCGYGSREEFEACGADFVLEKLPDVLTLDFRSNTPE